MSKVLMVASECTPYAKTGGLADVIGALPFALRDYGDEVAVVVPLYSSAMPKLAAAQRVYDRMPIQLGTGLYEIQIRRVVDRSVSIYFVDCPPLFDRPELYGEGGRD